jgi:hypothetical protein
MLFSEIIAVCPENYTEYTNTPPIPVAAPFKACVCGRSISGIVGSNPAGGIDVCLLWVLCVVKERPPHQADHSSRGVLPSVLRLECDRAASTVRRPWPHWGLSWHKKKRDTWAKCEEFCF